MYRDSDDVRESKMVSLSDVFQRFRERVVVVEPDDVIGPDEPHVEVEDRVCERCHGTAWLRRDVPAGHADFGKAVPCPCPLGQRARQRATERIWETAGIPKDFARYTFESFLRKNAGKKQLVEDLLAWEQTAAWGVLTGPVGVGKSALAAIVMHRALKRGESALFRVAPDVLSRIYASFGRDLGEDEPNEWQIMKSLEEPDLLVLDDFVVGNKPMKDDGQERFWRLIDCRYREAKRTVITSNVPMLAEHRDSKRPTQKLMSEYLWEQTYDRIRGRSKVFNLTGVSQRSLDDVTPSEDELEELPW